MADAPPNAVTLAVFRQGLAEHGWALGHNLVLAERSGEGHYDRLPELAAELLALPPDVVVTVSTPATVAARNATAAVPIVFATGSDPLADGLADSYQRPSGNVTGITVLGTELSAKRVQLLTEIAPGVSRLAVFWSDPAAIGEAQRAAEALGVQALSIEATSYEMLRRGLDAAVEWGADGLVFEPQPLVQGAMTEVVTFAAARRLPTMSGDVGFSGAGGLAAYAPRVQGNFRRAADYVDQILKGAKPADLPVEQTTHFDFVINLKTAQALGLTVPPHVLLQATEIVQ
jgi:putative ABC transport system substrate-binding protein